MAPLERTAYIYAAAQQRGWRVDWDTGRMIAPKPG